MKKVLLATSILAMSTGFAAAEITLSGDARMGIIDDFGADDMAFTSRARVKFTLSGETDGGLSFGASFRADNAAAKTTCSDTDLDGQLDTCSSGGGAVNGDAGEVFISGAFGKVTMGDIDGAAQQAVGNVDGVGLTGLGDLNEAVYIGAGDGISDPTAAYEYSSGAFTGIISVTNPAAGDETFALGMKYAAGDYTFALGYEDNPDLGFGVGATHIVAGVSAAFGAIALKANYGHAEDDLGFTADQYHVSATYTMDALALTAFYGDEDDFGAFGQGTAYGLGASYDLGGGAKVVGGYAKNDTTDEDAFDVGVSFSF